MTRVVADVGLGLVHLEGVREQGAAEVVVAVGEGCEAKIEVAEELLVRVVAVGDGGQRLADGGQPGVVAESMAGHREVGEDSDA